MLAVAMVVAMAVVATAAAAVVVAAFSVNKLDVKYAREQADLSVLVRIYNLLSFISHSLFKLFRRTVIVSSEQFIKLSHVRDTNVIADIFNAKITCH